MCGIAGWYRRTGRPVAVELVTAMCDAIAHRGPDDSGVFGDQDFGFGMRRLSIIDIAGGHQPMMTEDGRYAIVYNGEIYNHLELRPELEARGVGFRTQSDTETALAAFVRWGGEAWLRLEGMYAAAIWDRRERVLTLARDPLGIKPLYVVEQQGGIAFASELKSLLLLPDHKFEIDERAVHDFVSFGHVQRPRSIYRGVRQLDPGHSLTIGSADAASVSRFWKPRIRAAAKLSEAEWIEETRARVCATVKSHMLADVPVGSFLSGGVDSAGVTAAMARQTSAPVTAFTIGFPGNPIDETAAARRIADHLGCDHIVRPVDLGEARNVIPSVQRAFDEPTGASAAIPTWYLSKLAAEHVKVVLCGEGGDELFAGYKRHRNARRMDRLQPLISAMGPAAAFLDRLPAVAGQRARRFRESARLASGFERFIAGTEITSRTMRQAILEPDFSVREERSPDALATEYFSDPDWRGLSMLEEFMLGDLTVHMPSALLSRLDRTSMAHSLEARVPFLSHRFVDWSLTVPLAMKAKGVGKFVLRKAVRPWLPDGALDRPKQGFQMPLKDWFLGDFSDFSRAAFHDSGAAGAGYFSAPAVDALFAEHRNGQADHGKILYAIAMFSCWWGEGRVARAQPPGAPRRADQSSVSIGSG